MEVTVNWRRTEYYTSTITIPDSEVEEFAQMGGEDGDEPVEVTGEVVKDWLESSDPSDHLEANDRDWVHADDVQVDEVTLG